MKHNINSLTGLKLVAGNDEVGEVTDFYFDDKTWKIRYLIVETGSWLSDKKLLVSPGALTADSLSTGTYFKTSLTKEQLGSSPDIDSDLPVSRVEEEVLNRHHGWENYWETGIFHTNAGATDEIPTEEPITEETAQKYDLHLQSALAVNGYHIHAFDGELGHVNDFIIDDQTWQLESLVIDTHNWIGGKKVLLDVSHVKVVQWDNYEVFLDNTIADIESGKEFKEEEYNKS